MRKSKQYFIRVSCIVLLAATAVIAAQLIAPQMCRSIQDHGIGGSSFLRQLVCLKDSDQEEMQSEDPKIYLPLVLKNYCPEFDRLMPFAVQMLSEVSDPTAIALAAQGGAEWVRVSLSWSEIEPSDTTPENFNWGGYDEKFANLSAEELKVIVTISGNPAWARDVDFADYPGGLINTAYEDDFKEFLSALVGRYGVAPYNVKYWELYNEPDCAKPDDPPNCPANGGYWGKYPARYAEMLSWAYPAIKGADPQSQVVFGGIAYDWFTDDTLVPPGPFNRNFLNGVLNNGGGQYFDIMNFHYYVLFHGRWTPPSVIGKAAAIRSILAAHGLSKPLINTEIGSWSVDRSGPGGPDEYGGLEKQARYVVQGNVQGMAANLGMVTWFTLVDFESEWGYGLLNADYSEKPSYDSYRTLASELKGATFKQPATAPSGVEAYEFTVPCTQGQEWVLWTVGEYNRQMVFYKSKLRVMDMYGNVTYVSDGGSGDLDGTTNGQIKLSIGPNPIYVAPAS